MKLDSVPTDPVVHPEECWSDDGSDFRYGTLDELLDCHDDIEPGRVVYVGEPDRPDPADFIDADDVIELLACRGSDIGGEWAEDFPDITPEAKKELDELLAAWVTKHCEVRFYQVVNTREYVVTAEDLS